MINQVLTIDLEPNGRAPRVLVHASQYDDGREVRVNLTMEGEPYELPEGATVSLSTRKPSGSITYSAVAATAGESHVVFALTEQMTAEYGASLCELSIVGDGQDPIGTANWLMLVEMSPLSVGGPTDSWVPDIDRAIEQAEEYAEEAGEKVLDAEAWAVGQRAGEDVPSTDPTYENNAKYYAGAAEASATDAAEYAADAAAQATAAEGYAGSAAGSADNAAASAGAAAGSATEASGYATAASGYADNAYQYAGAAEAQAENAAASAGDAADSASASASSAADALGHARDAESAAGVAAGASEAAGQSATAASGYASTAQGHAANAAGSASAAAGSASQASTYAGNASASATQASGYADNASASAAEASGYADAAAESAAEVEAEAAQIEINKEDIADLKSAIDQIEQDITVVDTAVYVSGWSQGQVNPVNGGSSSSSYHCRTATFEFDKSGNYLVTPKQGYAILLNAYNGVPSSTTFISPVINFQTQPTLVSIDASYKYRWCVQKQDGTELAVADLPSDVVAYQFAEKVSDIITALTDRVDDAEESIVSVENSVAEVSGIPQLLTPMTLYPCYDHLFVNNTGDRAVIPHESIYHVNISRSLGYRVIEANVQITSDGHYFVNHLASGGTFGNFFYAVDGTDISQVAANTVTWQWIEDNVRYMSTVPKYRTRPTTLEEFLIGCKQNQLIPLLKFLDDNNIKAMTERIMGKNNYIVYGGTREMAGDAVIFRWETYSTLSEILEFCDSIGKPLIYGTSNFQNTFTKEETASVIEALHNHGYMVCMSYEANEFWRQYRPLGIDFCGGTRTTNRLVTGNTYNLENIFNTNDFTITGGTVTDNVITLTENGTITCANIDNANRQIAHVDLDVDFDGVLTLTGGLGEFRGNIDFDSTDGKLIVCTAVINKPINFTLTAKDGSATIKSIKYKVSIC